jgi:hypothetical protein
MDGGRVLLTSPGVLGDHAMPFARSLPLLGGASHDRLCATEVGYRQAISSRQVLRVSLCNTICEYVDVASTMLGIDNHSGSGVTASCTRCGFRSYGRIGVGRVTFLRVISRGAKG